MFVRGNNMYNVGGMLVRTAALHYVANGTVPVRGITNAQHTPCSHLSRFWRETYVLR